LCEFDDFVVGRFLVREVPVDPPTVESGLFKTVCGTANEELPVTGIAVRNDGVKERDRCVTHPHNGCEERNDSFEIRVTAHRNEYPLNTFCLTQRQDGIATVFVGDAVDGILSIMCEHENIRDFDTAGTEHVGDLFQRCCRIGFVLLSELCGGYLIRNRMVAEEDDIN